MKKRIAALTLLSLAITLTVGCGKNNSKNSTEVSSTEVTKVESTENTENTESTEQVYSDAPEETEITEIPSGTYVREVSSGLIKETQDQSSNKSTYEISYGSPESTGTETRMNIAFTGIKNIGSVKEKNETAGVWKSLENNKLTTVEVWSGGTIPVTDDGSSCIYIDKNELKNVEQILQTIEIESKTSEVDSNETYSRLIAKIKRTDTDESGYLAIIDDKLTGMRLFIQFLNENTEGIDYDTLYEMVKSVEVRDDIDYNTMSKELKVSEKPYTVEK